MSNSILTNPSLEKIHKIISVKFDVLLTDKQLLNLIDEQADPLRNGLLQEKIDGASLDMLVEALSERITGMHYPTQHSTPYYKEYYRKKLNENKEAFFWQPLSLFLVLISKENTPSTNDSPTM